MATGNLRLALAARAESGPALSLSLQQVYELHFRYVWRCLRGLGVADASLDDAVHDVFLVVQRKLPGFDGEQAALTTWLYAIALRVGRRYRAQRAKDGQRQVSGADADAEPPVSAGASDGEHELDRSQRLELARRALNALDDDKREAFVLACIEQRSAPDIARLTGVPLNTVYSRIRAARLAFKAEIDRLQLAERHRADLQRAEPWRAP